MVTLALLLAVLLLQAPAKGELAQTQEPKQGDYVVRDFRFASGETLAELRIHYRTYGQPRRDGQGIVRNAVLIMHGTGGSGAQFTGSRFAGALFGPGQLLDAIPVLHHPARRHRPRTVEQAERRPAREVSTLRLSRHDRGRASTGDRRPWRQPPASGHGHLDGRDAHLAVGRAVSRLHGRADAARQRAVADSRAESRLATDRDRRDTKRSGMERRRVPGPSRGD